MPDDKTEKQIRKALKQEAIKAKPSGKVKPELAKILKKGK